MRWFRSGTIYLLIPIALFVLLFRFAGTAERVESIDVTTLASQVKAGQIKRITVVGDELRVVRKEGTEVVSRKEPDVSVTEALTLLGVSSEELRQVTIEVESPSPWGNWLTLLGSIPPLILFGGLIFFLMRQAQGGTNQALSFGRSRARLFTGDKPPVTFDDV